MIRGFHFTWTCYGWWFPNDPRGSWSEEVWVPTIRGLGQKHLGRRPKQPTPQALRAWLAEAQRHLKHDPFILDGSAARAAAMGVHETVDKHSYFLHALAIMPDHAHVVVRRHRHSYERTVGNLKSGASKHVRRHLDLSGHLALHDPKERRRRRVPIWSRRYWVRYLNTEDHIHSAVKYVQQNPIGAGLKPQQWSFLIPV